jgi:hypothetical protein
MISSKKIQRVLNHRCFLISFLAPRPSLDSRLTTYIYALHLSRVVYNFVTLTVVAIAPKPPPILSQVASMPSLLHHGDPRKKESIARHFLPPLSQTSTRALNLHHHLFIQLLFQRSRQLSSFATFSVKRATRRIQPDVANYGSFSGDVWSRRLDCSKTVCLLVFQFLMVLASHVYIHRPLPHERHWYPPQACYLSWRFSSNLIVKSRDEISFKGGRL